MAVIDKLYKSMGLPMVIDRGSPWALDTTSVWYSRDLLEIYARGNAEELEANNLPATAYVGQEVSLVDETNKTVTVYVISDVEGTLTPVGGGAQVLCDDTTIVLNNGELSLKDYGHRYYHYVSVQGTKDEEDYIEAHYELQEVDENHPWKAGLEARVAEDAEGNLTLGWFEPNLGSVEDVTELVIALQQDVNTLADDLVSIESRVTDVESVNEELATKVNNTYRKDETYSRDKIDELVTGLFHFEGAVDSLEDLEAIEAKKGDVYQVGVDEYAWNGSEWIHLGNKYDLTGYLREEDLVDYAKTADVESQFQTIQSNLNAEVLKINANTEAIAGFEQQVGLLREAHTTFENNFTTFNGQIETINSSLEAIDGEIKTLKGEHTTFTNDIAELKQFVGAPSGDLGALYPAVESLITKINDLELNSGAGEFNVINAIAINGVALNPDDAKTIHLPIFNGSTSGLVPQVAEELTDKNNLFLNAAGQWSAVSIGNLGSYATVTDYVDAKVAEAVMTWDEI